MRARAFLSILITAVILSGWIPSLLAQTAKEFTLLTAMVAEGANLWLPSTIVVSKGDQVKLTLRNVSKAEHGFAIDELGVKEVIPAGETKEVMIKPGSAGNFRYYCHLHKGHVGGQLLVQ